MRFLFLLFLIVPIVEIYLLIEIGSTIGAGFTIFMIVLTALIGAALVRYQGFTTLARAQSELVKARMPAMEVLEGGMLLIAGALLLTPGFFTDAIGFALLTPPLRQVLIRKFMKGRTMPNPAAKPDAKPGQIIDAEYSEKD